MKNPNRKPLQKKPLENYTSDRESWHEGCFLVVTERSLTLDSREKQEPVIRPANGRSVCAVMACSDMQEAVQVGQCLSEQNTGCLVTYLKAEDLALNAPSGPVALVILATNDSAAVVGRTLQWLRNRYPGCPITVVGDVGGGEHEMAARRHGAIYLTRPVRGSEWSAILTHAFSRARKLLTGPADRNAATRQ